MEARSGSQARFPIHGASGGPSVPLWLSLRLRQAHAGPRRPPTDRAPLTRRSNEGT